MRQVGIKRTSWSITPFKFRKNKHNKARQKSKAVAKRRARKKAAKKRK